MDDDLGAGPAGAAPGELLGAGVVALRAVLRAVATGTSGVDEESCAGVAGAAALRAVPLAGLAGAGADAAGAAGVVALRAAPAALPAVPLRAAGGVAPGTGDGDGSGAVLLGADVAGATAALRAVPPAGTAPLRAAGTGDPAGAAILRAVGAGAAAVLGGAVALRAVPLGVTALRAAAGATTGSGEAGKGISTCSGPKASSSSWS